MKHNQRKKEISWNLLELTGLLEDEDSRVHFEKTRKHFALHSFHLMNLQAALNEILTSTLNTYDVRLKGFILVYKNPKLLTEFGEIFHDDCYMHVDIEADFYVFCPKVGCSLKGIVNKKGLDHIVILVHKVFTVSIPKPDNTDTWLGDSLKIGQEVRCYVTQIDKSNKLPYICATLNSDYLHGCKLPENIVNNIENAEVAIERNSLDSNNTVINNSTTAVLDTVFHTKKKKDRKRKRSLETDSQPVFSTESETKLGNITSHEMSEHIKYENEQQLKKRKHHMLNSDDHSLNNSEVDNVVKKHKKKKKMSNISTDLNTMLIDDHIVKIKVEKLDPISRNSTEEDLAVQTQLSHQDTNSTLDRFLEIQKCIKKEKSVTDDSSDKERKKSPKKHTKKFRDSDTESVIKPKIKKEKVTNNINNISLINTNEEVKPHVNCETTHTDTFSNNSDLDYVSKKPKKRKKSSKMSDSESENRIAKIKIEKV